MARLYANENFPLPVVEELRFLGHDVLTIHETGKAGQAVPDNQIVAFATTEKRAVLTINRKHFIKIHSLNQEHTGIIVCTLDLDFSGFAKRIHSAIQSQKSLSGQLIRINHPST